MEPNRGSVVLMRQSNKPLPKLGTYGHLAILGWQLVLVMLAPGSLTMIVAAISLMVTSVVYSGILRKSLRLRWLVMMLFLALPPVFFLGESDAIFAGLHYSSEGLLAGSQIACRFVVALVAVQGFTSAVGIPAIAGLIERFGLRGLGFSVGVALNLLPSLQLSSIHAWHALRMRGGLRKQWWRGLQLLVITIVTNALRRAEDIALAAEARAFSPENTRPLPVERGELDWVPTLIGSLSLIMLILL
jgi:energy-coupling factor transporter transmembrane protein EcfT